MLCVSHSVDSSYTPMLFLHIFVQRVFVWFCRVYSVSVSCTHHFPAGFSYNSTQTLSCAHVVAHELLSSFRVTASTLIGSRAMGSFGAERSNLKGVGKQRAQGKTIKLFAGVVVVNAFVKEVR